MQAARPGMPWPRGFTLIEMLVALAGMALLALLGWRGVDAMSRTIERTRDESGRVLALQMGLEQWDADLNALRSVPGFAPLSWDGAGMRLVRDQVPGHARALQVVAWALQGPSEQRQWVRWQSAPLMRRDELASALQQTAAWVRATDYVPSDSDVAIAPMLRWQVQVYQGGVWVAPLDATGLTGGSASSTPSAASPVAVRLQAEFPASGFPGGRLVKDWISAVGRPGP